MNSRPVLAGVLGALVIAFSGILVKLAEVSPSTAAVFRCLYALPMLGVLEWIEHRRYGPRSRRDRPACRAPPSRRFTQDPPRPIARGATACWRSRRE